MNDNTVVTACPRYDRDRAYHSTEWIGHRPQEDGDDGVERHKYTTGSINVDIRQSIDNAVGWLRSPEELAIWEENGELGTEDPIVVYCLTAIRASVGWLLLRELGAPDVRNYEGS